MNLTLAVLAAAISATPDRPTPLVELLFSNSLRNTGTLAGEGQFVECAPDEGPVFGPGVRGLGVSFAASSRGVSRAHTEAGGAVTLDAPSLGELEQMTLALWFKPICTNAPARLLYYAPCWDLFVAHDQVGFKVRHNGKDHHGHTERGTPSAVQDAWNFIAVTFDRRTGKGRCYHALLGRDVRVAGQYRLPPFGRAEYHLEIGNLAGIRPFKGYIDSVRIFDRALSHDQINALCLSEVRMQSLKDYVQNVPPRPAIFEYGDVCLSSRSQRPNSIETIEAFRASRLMWCYSANADFIKQCKDAGIETFQGAINSIPGTDETAAHALDFDGNPVVAPWMVAFNRKKPWYWGCNNRPRFMARSLARTEQALAAKADWIQFDDWAMVVSAAGWDGACFCDECLAAFRQYLKDRLPAERIAELGIHDVDALDYRAYLSTGHEVTDAKSYKDRRRSIPTTSHFEDFQRRSVRQFFVELRKAIDEQAGRTVPLSINSTFFRPDQRSNYIADIVDFLQGETWHMSLVDLAVPSKVAEGLGKWQVFVPKPRDVRVARMAIAASYALGQLMLVPWDMYMGSDATGIRPRYYGTVEQYGDLFHFVRDNPQLFSGYEATPMVGLLVDLDRYDKHRTEQTCQRLLAAQVPFAIVPLGHSYFECTLDAERLRGFHTLIITGDFSQYADRDRQAIEHASGDVAILSDRDATVQHLESISPFEIWGPSDGIHILSRAKRDAERRKLVCHVLNRVDMADAQALKWVSFVIRKSALLGSEIAAIRWYTPGKAAQALECEALTDGVRVIIPQLPIWGIAEVTLK